MVDEQKLRQLADQLICHPVSRSIEEIEAAGEAIKDLLDELQTLRSERTAWRVTAENAEAAVKQARIDALEEAKADMFWNSEDAEKPHYSIGCFLNDQICQHDLEVGAEFTIWRAKKMPSVNIRVTAIDDEECEAEYEVIESLKGKTP